MATEDVISPQICHYFKWEIENMMKRLKEESFLLSQEFRISTLQKEVFMLQMTEDEESRELYLSIHLQDNFVEGSRYMLRYFALASRSMEAYTDSVEWIVTHERTSQIFKFMSRVDVNDCCKKSNFVIEIYMHPLTTFRKKTTELSKDLGAFVNNKAFSDLTLIVQNVKISAHKNILSARSSVFTSMFTHDNNEQCENTVYVDDVQPSVMMEMLNYVYSDNVENLDKIAEELLIVADKYALDGLKNKCVDYLYRNINSSNIASILVLAYKHSLDSLQMQAMNYIKWNTVKVIDNLKFLNLFHTQPELMRDLFCYVTNCKK